MKLSVALCTFNGAEFIQEQLSSLASQSCLPDELVVCDDGSIDGRTLDTLEHFSKTAPFPVKLYKNPQNLGSTKNFEKAIGLCEGNLICLCDQDDVWHEDKLARTVAAFEENPQAGLVFCDAEVVDEKLQPLAESLWRCMDFDSEKQHRLHNGQAFEVLLPCCVVAGNSMAFRAEFKNLILPIPNDTIMLHDGWIAAIIGAVAQVVCIDEPLVLFRQHAAQQNGAYVPVRGGTDPSRNSALLSSIKSIPYAQGRVQKLMVIEKRLREAGSMFDNPYRDAALTALEKQMTIASDEMDHLQIRESLPEQRAQRLWKIFNELVGGRYQLYSNGLRSVVKDFLS